jgi:hypothetical protein
VTSARLLLVVATTLAASACGGGGGGGTTNARSCAVYAADGSAVVEYSGDGASAACHDVLEGVPPRDTTWTSDAVDPLTGHRDVVCALKKRPLKVTILDTGLHTIGRSLCSAYAAAGWS